MLENDKDFLEKTAKAFEKGLNRHGYGFQYSVLRKTQELASQHRSVWRYIAPEFPVEVQGKGTRIDFILKHSRRQPIYMLAECKRANPAISNWCFVKVPYTPPVSLSSEAYIETIVWNEVGGIHAGIRRLIHSDNIFHLALEVKTGERGDPGGQGRSARAIEDAATQVCRGLNGIMNFFRDNLQVFGEERVIGFLPVIFTTARLWASNVHLGSADLEYGKFDLSGVDLEPKPWLFYHYYQSPGLKHSIPPTSEVTDLQDILYNEYVRTIPIVSASGIDEFLSASMWEA